MKTVDQLMAEMASLKAQIEEARKREVKEVRSRIEEILGRNYTIRDIYPELFLEVVVEADPTIRFIDPANPDNTWKGIGPRPQWLREYVEAGRDVEEFRVRR